MLSCNTLDFTIATVAETLTRTASRNIITVGALKKQFKNLLTMKISANHPTPLGRPDYHIYNNSLVPKKWSLHYDHDTNYIPP